MSGELLDRVIAEVNKTGFPQELRVANRLRARGYHVATNVYFVDRDEGKGREVDIRGLRNEFFNRGGRRRAVRHCLLIECKKSTNRPWVFFTSPTVSYDQTLTGVLCHGVSGRWIRDFDEAIAMHKRHPWFRLPERGRSFFEPFASTADASPTIQKAVLGAIKACIEAHETRFAGAYTGLSNAIFYYPLVVLDGELFVARLRRSGLAVARADQVAVSVRYRSSQYPLDDVHTVLVVREEAFGKAVRALDRWLQYCAETFKGRLGCFAPARGPHRGKRKKSRRP